MRALLLAAALVALAGCRGRDPLIEMMLQPADERTLALRRVLVVSGAPEPGEQDADTEAQMAAAWIRTRPGHEALSARAADALARDLRARGLVGLLHLRDSRERARPVVALREGDVAGGGRAQATAWILVGREDAAHGSEVRLRRALWLRSAPGALGRDDPDGVVAHSGAMDVTLELPTRPLSAAERAELHDVYEELLEAVDEHDDELGDATALARALVEVLDRLTGRQELTPALRERVVEGMVQELASFGR